jgi:hypothetical protein
MMIGLISCDPGIGLVISNKTAKEQTIKVVYPASFKFPGDNKYNFGIRDSVKTYEQNVKYSYLYPLIVPRLAWDTVARTYTFNLKANHIAIIESWFGATHPTYGQVFIINNRDTVALKEHSKLFIKRPKLAPGGTWSYTIDSTSGKSSERQGPK